MRRLGFLYHGTLSSATMREITGSTGVLPPAMLETGAVFASGRAGKEDTRSWSMKLCGVGFL